MTELKKRNLKNIYLIDKVADEDMFHHAHFADVLWKIITDNTLLADKTPFNVGIFGKWGVGKSTVINLFQKHLIAWNANGKNKKRFKFIEFKVWKFSENALRRKFIFTIGKHVLGKDELNTLYARVRAKKTLLLPLLAAPEHLLNAFKNWKENFPWPLLKLASLVATVAVFLVIALSFNFNWKWLQSFADWCLLFFAVYSPGLLISAIGYIGASINEAKVEIAYDQFDSEEQFEEEFSDLMGSNKNEIKIVFIDDLDRCSKEKVIQTLETIKTYLDVPTCIFIIACDDAIICNVVETKRKEHCAQEGDGLEYLNKFFQYTIRIPPFIQQNMREYALELLQKNNNDLSNLPDIEEILRILIHSGVKTPRKSILLINNFATDLEVVLTREEEGKIHPGYISTHLPVLAFFSVLKTDYRDFFDLLVADHKLVRYVLQIEARANDFAIEEHHKQILRKVYDFERDVENYEVREEAKDFVLLVKGARDPLSGVDDFSPFIYLKSDSSSILLPSDQYRDLDAHLRNGLSDEVREMLTKLIHGDEKKAHFNVIVNILTDIKSLAEKRRAFKTFFDITDFFPDDEQLRQSASIKTMSIFADLTRSNPKWLEEFNVAGVMFFLRYLKADDQKTRVVKEIVDAVEKAKDKGLAKRWLKAILSYPELVTSSESARIRKIMDRRELPKDDKDGVFYALPEIFEWIREFKNDAATLRLFFVGKIIEEISQAIVALDGVDPRTEAQEADYQSAIESYDVLDEGVLTQKAHLLRRIKILTTFLPTSNKYYREVIKKISGILPQLNEENSNELLAGLVAEVPNVEDAENFKELLSVIDDISSKYKVKPIEVITPLAKSLGEVVIESFEGPKFVIATDLLVKMLDDQRFSATDSQVFYEVVASGINASENIARTQKLTNFVLQNKRHLNPVLCDKIFSVFVREILDVKSYDLTQFSNNEAIAYWSAVEDKILSLISDIDKLVTDIVVGKGILSAATTAVTLTQKSILVQILRNSSDRYSAKAKEHLVRLLIPYLKDAQMENIAWGCDQLHVLFHQTGIRKELDLAIQQEIISALYQAFSKIQNESTRRNALSILISCDEEVIKAGGDVLSKMLTEIKYQLGSGKDNSLGFSASVKHYQLFTLDEQIQICGLYLGSSVYSADASKELILKIKEALPKTPSTPISDETAGDVSEVPADIISEKTQEGYIEKYILSISADEKAWTFFSALFAELESGLDEQLKREMTSGHMRKIKSEDEAPGISRNRFTVINILKNQDCFSEADIDSMFNNLFSSDSEIKVRLACDFFDSYFKGISKIRNKGSRNSYKHAIEQASKRWEDSLELTARLSALL